MDHPPVTTGRDPIALQIRTIRDAIASDADAALHCTRAAGFTAVELAPPPPGLAVGPLAECLARLGLAVDSINGDLPTPANIASWAELSDACRCSKAIRHGLPRDPRFDSLVGLLGLIAGCNRAGSLARGQGLRFGMHNHWWAFEPVGRVAPIHLLYERLVPEIFWQLDVYSRGRPAPTRRARPRSWGRGSGRSTGRTGRPSMARR